MKKEPLTNRHEERVRRRKVVFLRHSESFTFKEIGKEIGFSGQRAREIYCAAVNPGLWAMQESIERLVFAAYGVCVVEFDRLP